MRFKTYLGYERLDEFSYGKKDYIGSVVRFADVFIKKSERSKYRFSNTFEKYGFKTSDTFQYLGLIKPKGKYNTIILTDEKKNIVVYIKKDKKIYQIIVAKSIRFAQSLGGKSNRHNETKLHETISMWMFQYEYTEEGIIKKINKELPRLADSYRPSYYVSAIKHRDLFLSKGYSQNMVMERQGENLSSRIYDLGRSFSGINKPDNWNPGDVWCFTSQGKKAIDNFTEQSDYNNMMNLKALNDLLRENLNSKDIVSISLKQIPSGSGQSSIIDSKNPPEIDVDLTQKIKSTYITASSLKSAYVNTNSDIQIKGNMKGSSTDPSLYIELYSKSDNHHLGAIDINDWVNKISTFSKFAVYSGTKKPTDLSKDTFNDYKKLLKGYSKKIDNSLMKNVAELGDEYTLYNVEYEHLNDTEIMKYITCVSFICYVLYQFENDKLFPEWCYYASMKINDKSSSYVLFE